MPDSLHVINIIHLLCRINVPLVNADRITKVKEKVKMYPFPSDPESRQMWDNTLPNKLTEVIVCIKHWPENHETFMKKGKVRPVNPPSEFEVPKSFCIQSASKSPRNIAQRKFDQVSKLSASEKREENADLIQDWNSLVSFLEKIPNVAMQKEINEYTLFRTSGCPPKFELLFCYSPANKNFFLQNNTERKMKTN